MVHSLPRRDSGLCAIREEPARSGNWGIAMGGGDDAGVLQCVTGAGVPYLVLLPSASAPLVDAIQALPTTFLADKEGRTIQKYFGLVSEKIVREDIDRLRAER